MNPRSIPLLFLPVVFILLMVACGGSSQIADTAAATASTKIPPAETSTPLPAATPTQTSAFPVVTLNDINLKNAAIRLMDLPDGTIFREEAVMDASSADDIPQRALDLGWQGHYWAAYQIGGMILTLRVDLFETVEGARRSVPSEDYLLTENRWTGPEERISLTEAEVTGLGDPSAAFLEVVRDTDGKQATATSVYFVRGNIRGFLMVLASSELPMPSVEYVTRLALKHEARIVKELLSASTPKSPQAATVSFPDEDLEAVIRKLLGKTSSQSLTVEDLADITSIDTTWFGLDELAFVSDLSGIENCVNLTYLKLFMTTITDLSPLAGHLLHSIFLR